jgi:hypothetical protein
MKSDGRIIGEKMNWKGCCKKHSCPVKRDSHVSDYAQALDW